MMRAFVAERSPANLHISICAFIRWNFVCYPPDRWSVDGGERKSEKSSPVHFGYLIPSQAKSKTLLNIDHASWRSHLEKRWKLFPWWCRQHFFFFFFLLKSAPLNKKGSWWLMEAPRKAYKLHKKRKHTMGALSDHKFELHVRKCLKATAQVNAVVWNKARPATRAGEREKKR